EPRPDDHDVRLLIALQRDRRPLWRRRRGRPHRCVVVYVRRGHPGQDTRPGGLVAAGRRVPLCMKDLYQQGVGEMVERETRQFEMWEILDPDDPAFRTAYDALWDAFGESGEMEREDAIRRYMRDDAFEPTPTGTYVRYFLLAARNGRGELLG